MEIRRLVGAARVWPGPSLGTEEMHGGRLQNWKHRNAEETTMAGAAGGVGQTGVTEVYTAASAIAIPTIRTVAADLAARADFDLDSIADLRMAVDDTCTRLVRLAACNATLSCSFAVRVERIEVTAEVDVNRMMDPLPRGSFSWWVLRCLADEVTALVLPGEAGQGGRVCIILVKQALSAGLS